ncbi:sugar ABC transporter permease [Candidatus Izemoplasma sp. B36]|uniref:sugar ABC transporter permease n=1 Tax=Candidatus Izemoplasma sp. B36 TaxID=3242468 RepID=UPI00355724DC
MSKKKIKKLITKFILNLFFISIIFITLIPIFYAISVSLSETNSLVSSEFSLFHLDLSYNNYLELFKNYDIGLWFINSTILAVATLVFALGISIPAAYGFSRIKFKGRNSIFKTLILLNAFPTILSMFAIWRIMSTGPVVLVNTRIGLVIIYTGTMAIFGIMNMKGYFDTVPNEIEEAAKIDGASDFQVITKVLLPLAKPSIIVTGMMILIYVWNEYIFSITFMTGEENFTLAAGLYSLQANETSGSWPIFAAAALLTSIPVLIIFLLAQKHMVSGLTVGGVKA